MAEKFLIYFSIQFFLFKKDSKSLLKSGNFFVYINNLVSLFSITLIMLLY
jgi:hypothetical protein